MEIPGWRFSAAAFEPLKRQVSYGTRHPRLHRRVDVDKQSGTSHYSTCVDEFKNRQETIGLEDDHLFVLGGSGRDQGEADGA